MGKEQKAGSRSGQALSLRDGLPRAPRSSPGTTL